MRQLMDAIAYILAAIVSGIFGWWHLHVKGKLERTPQAVQDHNRINECLASLRFRTQAIRCVIVRTHNGGGVPSAKTPLYSTALYEVSLATPLHPYWQALPVDPEMTEHLSRLVADHRVEVHAADISQDGIMAKLYASDDAHPARTVYKYYLTHDKRSIYYLSVQWEDEGHRPRNLEALAIERTINDIRKILTEA